MIDPLNLQYKVVVVAVMTEKEDVLVDIVMFLFAPKRNCFVYYSLVTYLVVSRGFT